MEYKYVVRITAEVSLSEPIKYAKDLPEFDISYQQSAVLGNLHWAEVMKVTLVGKAEEPPRPEPGPCHHMSDCAVHNEPAYPKGKCDCCGVWAMPVPITDKPIVTARVGKNADIFVDILRLYVPEGSVIADVTYNRGAFWRKVDRSKYHVLASDVDRVKNDIVADMGWLPYRTHSLDAIVIDPPYGHGTSPNMNRQGLEKQYGLAGALGGPRFIRQLYRNASYEAQRTLSPGGIAIVKCQDMVDSSEQHWMSDLVKNDFEAMGFDLEDRFVLVRESTPMMRHDYQVHARKNHSYFLIFKKPSRRTN